MCFFKQRINQVCPRIIDKNYVKNRIFKDAMKVFKNDKYLNAWKC